VASARVLAPAVAAKDVGRFATLQDAQGAVFAILQPEMPPR